MSVFERYLSLWVALCILAGIFLGQAFPGPVQAIGAIELAQVNLPVGLLIWVMIIPMLIKVAQKRDRRLGQSGTGRKDHNRLRRVFLS